MNRRSLLGMLAGLSVSMWGKPPELKAQKPELPADVDKKDLPDYRASRLYFYGGGPPSFHMMTEADKKRYK